MENASKALVMAGGILLGVLLLTLMVTTFLSSRELSIGYDKTKHTEAIEQFNANFIKYVGKELTMHDVITIRNFAKENNVTVIFPDGNGKSDEVLLKEYLDNLSEGNHIFYHIKIQNYVEGKVSSIRFERHTVF